MAHMFARLRIADPITGIVARLTTGSGGLTLGRAGFAPAGRQTKFHEVIASSFPFDPHCLVALIYLSARGVDVAQGDDFTHVVVRIETPLFKFEVVRLCPRRQREKPHEELVITGFFALLQEWLGVIGVFNILESIVASSVAGDELVTPIDA